MNDKNSSKSTSDPASRNYPKEMKKALMEKMSHQHALPLNDL